MVNSIGEIIVTLSYYTIFIEQRGTQEHPNTCYICKLLNSSSESFHRSNSGTIVPVVLVLNVSVEVLSPCETGIKFRGAPIVSSFKTN